MSEGPKFRRRKEARPAEILTAALDVFGEKGFAGARLDDIAKRAGISKGALYLYYATKEDLFAAVITQAIAKDLGRVRSLASNATSFSALMSDFLALLIEIAAQGRIPPIARMVISESRTFPDLAREWHDQVITPMLAFLTTAIREAQARGEVRDGDPRFFAYELIGPFVIGILWNETFAPIGAAPLDLQALRAQHVRTLVDGMLTPEAPR